MCDVKYLSQNYVISPQIIHHTVVREGYEDLTLTYLMRNIFLPLWTVLSPTPDTYVHAFYQNSEACLQWVVSNYPVVDKTEVI